MESGRVLIDLAACWRWFWGRFPIPYEVIFELFLKIYCKESMYSMFKDKSRNCSP